MRGKYLYNQINDIKYHARKKRHIFNLSIYLRANGYLLNDHRYPMCLVITRVNNIFFIKISNLISADVMKGQ